MMCFRKHFLALKVCKTKTTSEITGFMWHISTMLIKSIYRNVERTDRWRWCVDGRSWWRWRPAQTAESPGGWARWPWGSVERRRHCPLVCSRCCLRSRTCSTPAQEPHHNLIHSGTIENYYNYIYSNNTN